MITKLDKAIECLEKYCVEKYEGHKFISSQSCIVFGKTEMAELWV